MIVRMDVLPFGGATRVLAQGELYGARPGPTDLVNVELRAAPQRNQWRGSAVATHVTDTCQTLVE